MKVVSNLAGTITLQKNIILTDKAHTKHYQLITTTATYAAKLITTASILVVHLQAHSKASDTLLISSEESCNCLLLSLNNTMQARINTKPLLLHEHSYTILHLPAPSIEITLLPKQHHEIYLFCFPQSWLSAYTYAPITPFLNHIESGTIYRYKEGHTIANPDMILLIRSLDRAHEHTTITNTLRFLLTEALRTIETQPIYEPVKLKDAQLMYKVRAYIDAHFTTPNLSTKNIADAVKEVSEHQIKTYFERVYAKNIHNYINDLRLTRSVDLLTDHSRKVRDIARDLGFDPSTFTRLFKSRYDLTPDEFRASRNMQKG